MKFLAIRSACTLLTTAGFLLHPPSEALAQSLRRIPAISGKQPSEAAFAYAIAPDRSRVFLSVPDGYVANDTNGWFDVVEHDLATGVSSIVVHALGGGPTDGHAHQLTLSSGGRRLAFRSAATNLVAGDTNGVPDAFVLERATGAIQRASLGNSNAEGLGSLHGLDVSDDGRFVVFASDSDNFVSGSASPHVQAFLRDMLQGTTELLSRTPLGAPGDGPTQAELHVSDDGRFAVFWSWASDLVAGDTNSLPDVFLRDRLVGTTSRIDVGPGGAEADGPVSFVQASADLSRIAFVGYATTLVPGTDGRGEVYLYDRPTGALSVVSVGPGGLGVNSGGFWPMLSNDGRWIAFASDAVLDPSAPPIAWGNRTFLLDLALGGPRVVSDSTGGSPGMPVPQAYPEMYPQCVIDGGSMVAFKSNRLGLVAGDTNEGGVDVFLWDGLSTCPPIESFCVGKPNSHGCVPAMSASGEPHVGGLQDAFYLATSELVSGKIALILWSSTSAAIPFDGGTLCVSGAIKRTPVQPTGGTGNAACTDGSISFHFSQAYMAARGIGAGLTLFAQACGRDEATSAANRLQLSDGIRFTTCP